MDWCEILRVRLLTSLVLLNELHLDLLKILQWHLGCRIKLHRWLLHELLEISKQLGDSLLACWLHRSLLHHPLLHQRRIETLGAALRWHRRLDATIYCCLFKHIRRQHSTSHEVFLILHLLVSQVVGKVVAKVGLTVFLQLFDKKFLIISHELCYFIISAHNFVFEKTLVWLFTFASAVQILAREILSDMRKVTIIAPVTIIGQKELAKISPLWWLLVGVRFLLLKNFWFLNVELLLSLLLLLEGLFLLSHLLRRSLLKFLVLRWHWDLICFDYKTKGEMGGLR